MKILLHCLALSLLLAGCGKNNVRPHGLYYKSGIWEIKKATTTYMQANGTVDSTREYTDPGFFIFYNMITYDQPRNFYNGQRAYQTGSTSKKAGMWWFTDGDELHMGPDTTHVPDRVYIIDKKSGSEQTWTYDGDISIGGSSMKYKEILEVKEVKY